MADIIDGAPGEPVTEVRAGGVHLIPSPTASR